MARIPEGPSGRTTRWSPARVAKADTPKGLAGPAVFFAVTVAALYFAREILIPIVLAMLLSFVLGALVHALRKVRVPRLPAIFLSVAIAFGILAALGTTIGLQLADLAGQASGYGATIEGKVEGLKAGAVGRMTDTLRVLGRELHRAGTPDQAAETPPAREGPARGTAAAPAQEAPKPVLVEIREPEQSPMQLARAILTPTLQPLTTAGIVLIVLMFILIQREDLRDRMIRLFGSNDLHRTTLAMDDAAKRLSRYFVVQLGLNAAFGLVIGLGLMVIGVPNPVLWGIFAALMRFVPYIGAFLSALLPLALATAVDPGWTMVLATLALFLVVEPITGQVIEPLIYGHSTGLSPFAVLVSALFWTWLWGPVGLLLSTPLTVCLVVLGRHAEPLEFLDVLFGDRPALTPVENFYQRLLADDADEAQEQAEALLQERSLSSYYDAVALEGLRLAAIDAQRGVLTPGQLERVRASIDGLVEELARYDDVAPAVAESLSARLFTRRERAKEPPGGPAPVVQNSFGRHGEPPGPWRAEGAVLCVPARGPLDEAAATLLVQLLTKHGFGVRLVPHAAVSRTNLPTLDARSVRMVCVVHLDMVGTSAHLRFLTQRLRRHIPEAGLAVGIWPGGGEAVADASPRDVDADVQADSLTAMVEACTARAAGEPPPPMVSPSPPPLPSAEPAREEAPQALATPAPAEP